MPRIYPVIATRNRERKLTRQIDGLLPQLLDGERIIIVVDGGTCPAIENEKLTIIRLAENVGVDAARRIGNAYVPAHGVVCEIDDHDYAAPTLLAELRQAFSDKAILLAYCDVDAATTDGAFKIGRIKEGRSFRDANLGWGMRSYRKWAYDFVGGYPLEDYPANDYVLCCKIEQLGGGPRCLKHIPRALVTVTWDVTGISLANAAEQKAVFKRVAERYLNGEYKLPFSWTPPTAAVSGPTRTVAPIALRPQTKAVAVRGEAYRPIILLVTEIVGYGRGGGELSMLAMLKRLHESGYDVHALYTTDAGDEPYQSDWLTLHKIDGLSFREAEASESIALITSLESINPAVVITEVRTGPNIVDACVSLGIPVVTMVQFWHGLVRCDADGMNGIHERPIPESVKNAQGIEQHGKSSAVVANSEFTDEVIRECLGRSADAVVYPPVKPVALTSRTPEYIVCPSVQAGKGSMIFLDLATQNSARRFRLLAGDDKHCKENSVVSRAESLSNVEVVREWVHDMTDIYASCACLFIGTQTCESFSRSCAEAISCGVPLLVSDAGNMARIVDAEHGVIVPRKASIAEWQAGLDKALRLNPEPDAQYCQDHTQRLTEVVDGIRNLPEVGMLVPNAAGVKTGADEYTDVLGIRLMPWDCSISDVSANALTIIPGEPRLDISLNAQCKIAYWWCSHLAQMDTNRHEARDLCRVIDHVAETPNRWLMFTCETDALAWANVLGDCVKWLPNVMALPTDQPNPVRLTGRHVFIPGPYGARKNVFASLGAIASAGAEAHVTARAESQCSELSMIAQRLGVPVHIHDCATRSDVLHLAEMCGAAIMLSSAETYCLAAAECVMAGTPCAGWRGIPILRQSPASLMCDDPTDVRLAAIALEAALSGEETERQRVNMYTEIERLNAVARRTLTEVLND